jgi:hypothetical protein
MYSIVDDRHCFNQGVRLMFRKTTSGFKAALIITATLFAPALSNSSPAIAETPAVVQDADTVAAAQNLLQTMGFKTNLQPLFATFADRMKLAVAADPGLRNTPLDVRQLALQLCHQSEDELLADVAKYYATRFTADELRAAQVFYASPVGALFLDFNREQAAGPATRESASSAFVKRFAADQRTAIVRFLSGEVGQKMLRLQPELSTKIKEIAGEWGLKIGFDLERAIRSNRPATLSRI